MPVPLPDTEPAGDVRLLPRGNMLPPRTRQWPTVATATAVGAVTVYAGADLVGYGEFALPGAGLLGISTAVIGAYGVRTRHRDNVTDRAVEAFAPVLGWPRPGRVLLKVRKWGSGLQGLPTRFDLVYNGAGMTVEPGWFTEVNETVRRRGWGHFTLARHDERRCILTFEASAKQEARDTDHTEVRVKRTVNALFGTSAKVSALKYDDENVLQAFDVSHEISHKLAPAGYRARLEKVVSTTFPGRWRARWNLEEDTVVFEQRPVMPTSLWNPEAEVPSGEDLKADYEKTAIRYARDEDGTEHVWRPAINPHFLLIGSTGTGKTATGHSILVEFTRHGWPVWVIDAKGIEFLAFQDWPNVQVLGTHLGEQIAILYQAWRLMEFRYAQVVNGQARRTDYEPLLLVTDEFAEFMSNLRQWYPQNKVKGDPAKPPAMMWFDSLARKARTCRIHLLTSLQRPDAEIFGSGESRDNFRQRYSIGHLSPEGAGMTWGSQSIGTTIPAGLRGRGTSLAPGGEPKEAQSYRIPDPANADDPEDSDRLARLRPAESSHERMLIKKPTPSAETLIAWGFKDDHDDPDVLASVDPSFRDWRDAEWVHAADHPHLDPVVKRAELAESGHHDPNAGSPLAALGLERRIPDPAITYGDVDHELVEPAPSRPPLQLVPDPDDEPTDDWPGYGEHRDVPAHDAQLGDLLCLDETADTWAVIDTEPGEDFVNPDELLITWRGFGDEDGTTTFSPGEYVRIRRPDTA